MTHKSDGYTRQDREKKERAGIVTKFREYCSEQQISISRNPALEDRNPAYAIWNALHGYNPSKWGSVKKAAQDKGPVQATAQDALKELELDFARRMVKGNASPPTFDTLLENIENSIQNLTQRILIDISSNKDEIFSMLSLLSGDSFALLKNIVQVDFDWSSPREQALKKLETIQNNFYVNIVRQLRLPDTTARNEVRNACFLLKNSNEKSTTPPLEAEALSCTEQIDVFFQDYFYNVLYQLTNINISEIIGEECSISVLLPHLKDTSYENELNTAIHILSVVSPQNDLSYTAVASHDSDISKLNGEETTGAEIKHAALVSTHVDGSQVATLVAYCVDQQLAIPNTKGSSGFYDALNKTIETLCRQYAADEDFCADMNAKIYALTESKSEMTGKVDTLIAQVKANYSMPLNIDALSRQLYKHMLKAKEDHIKNTAGATGKIECAELDKKIGLLNKHFRGRIRTPNYSNGNLNTIYQQPAPSAPPAVAEQKNIK